ncbi:MAG TPA: HK97 family phage prohead protease [Urbifossiella sp.]|nr:HK97 family phage prohead protease [Urbifossiella sp.]
MTTPLQRRYTRSADRVALQARADGKPSTITGYAAVFYDPSDPGTEYRLYDDLVERIMPGAFDRALREDDVRGLFNHDDNLILGRTAAGTMRLSVDRRGLKYEIDPPDTTTARDLLESLRRGDVSGSSFAFKPKDTSTRIVDGTYILERNAVYLFDVGPVCFPAYTGTEAGVRSVRAEVEAWEAGRRGRTPAAVLARARAVETILAEG